MRKEKAQRLAIAIFLREIQSTLAKRKFHQHQSSAACVEDREAYFSTCAQD
jgi:hypothetical protein